MKQISFNEGRRFGVEIECIGVTNRYAMADLLQQAGIPAQVGATYSSFNPDVWTFASDSSVHGAGACEVKSPILRGIEGLEQIKQVVRILTANGVTVNKTCGLHVHHDIQDFDGDQFAKFLWVALQTDFIYRRMQPDSRYSGGAKRWCKPFNQAYSETTIKWFDERNRGKNRPRTAWRNDLQQVITHDRYIGINLRAYWSKGTVEFRHHSGTVNADKIIAWVVGTQMAVERAAQDKKIRINRNWSDPLVEGTRRLGLRANGYNQPDELVDWAGKELAKRYRKYAGRRTYQINDPLAA